MNSLQFRFHQASWNRSRVTSNRRWLRFQKYRCPFIVSKAVWGDNLPDWFNIIDNHKYLLEIISKNWIFRGIGLPALSYYSILAWSAYSAFPFYPYARASIENLDNLRVWFAAIRLLSLRLSHWTLSCSIHSISQAAALIWSRLSQMCLHLECPSTSHWVWNEKICSDF